MRACRCRSSKFAIENRLTLLTPLVFPSLCFLPFQMNISEPFVPISQSRVPSSEEQDALHRHAQYTCCAGEGRVVWMSGSDKCSPIFYQTLSPQAQDTSWLSWLKCIARVQYLLFSSDQKSLQSHIQHRLLPYGRCIIRDGKVAGMSGFERTECMQTMRKEGSFRYAQVAHVERFYSDFRSCKVFRATPCWSIL